MTTFDVPDDLADAILEGRCIAFVGAGFSQPAVPDWKTLLAQLGAELGVDAVLPPGASALDHELLGQALRHAAKSDERFEAMVKAILERPKSPDEAGEQGRRDVARRVQQLRRIPFKAILTTNFDTWLSGDDESPDTYWKILREEEGRWWEFPVRSSDPEPDVHIIKLHGEANGMPDRAPLVLGRADYRRRIYGEHGYTAFIRAAFAQYTVVFLGVSFTDAYLNELRSETLQLLRGAYPGNKTPWGYATMKLAPSSEQLQQLYLEHEGIKLLPMADYPDFDRWLDAIVKRTSAQARLQQILAGKKIIWVDAVPENNARGHELLASCGATVISLTHARELRPEMRDAALLVTHFGYQAETKDSAAFQVMQTLREWPERPPVIVFADPNGPVEQNRVDCLRRGAWEYATDWGELYRLIEVMFTRCPGNVHA